MRINDEQFDVIMYGIFVSMYMPLLLYADLPTYPSLLLFLGLIAITIRYFYRVIKRRFARPHLYRRTRLRVREPLRFDDDIIEPSDDYANFRELFSDTGGDKT